MRNYTRNVLFTEREFDYIYFVREEWILAIMLIYFISCDGTSSSDVSIKVWCKTVSIYSVVQKFCIEVWKATEWMITSGSQPTMCGILLDVVLHYNFVNADKWWKLTVSLSVQQIFVFHSDCLLFFLLYLRFSCWYFFC